MNLIGTMSKHPVWTLIVLNLIAIAGQQIVGRFVLIRSRKEHAELLGHIAGVTGVINAVLLAFIVFVAWTYYDRARDSVDREVGVIWQVWRDIETADPGSPMYSAMDSGVHDLVVNRLMTYVDSVAFREWPIMNSRDSLREDKKPDPDSLYHAQFAWCDSIISDAYESVLLSEEPTQQDIGSTRSAPSPTRHRAGTVSSAARRALGEEIVRRFNQLFLVRQQRIAYSTEDAIPFMVWKVLFGSGLLCICCCWLIPFKGQWLHAAITGLVASSLSLILILILELNTPFRGRDAILNTAFTRLQLDIDAWEDRDERRGHEPEHEKDRHTGEP